MSTITLDQLRADVEVRYGPVVITGIDGGDVSLLPAMRLTTEKRAALMAAQKRSNYDPTTAVEDYDEQVIVNAIHEILRIAAATPDQGDRLVMLLGSDLAMLMVVLETYGKETQLGGSLGLAGLIDSYAGALGYDLLSELGTPLRAVIADLCSDAPADDPRWWLALIAQLPDTGALAAELMGGPEHRGWGLDRHLRAATYDALNVNTAATGNFKRRPPVTPWPRPARPAQPRHLPTASLDEALPI